MSVGRALVDCVVLSLRDGCVFYPSCKSCLSRIDVGQQDTTRCRCSRCGLSCLREEVDYRYRLPLRVTHGGCIIGVTVFGTCLNQFFGIPAGGLQRLVQNSDGPVEASVRSTLLRKAVEDCFIGRRFIFGIKVTEGERGPWLGGPAANGSGSKDTVHFIATQMILPKATGLGGCTVVSYYRVLLQRAAESTDPSSTSRPPATTALLLVPRRSPPGSFSNATLCSSGLLSRSLQRSQSQDCTLTPTPPWQQSLGLVTSSAEQEESCSTQDSEEENRRQTENCRTPLNAQRGRLQDHRVTEETPGLSLLLSLERSACNCTSFAEYPHISAEEAVEKTPTVNTCFSPSPPRHNVSEVKALSTSSVAWEDLPFSESLTEFLCEQNKDFKIVSETDTNRKGTARNNLEIRSQDKNLSTESTSVCQSSSQMLLEIPDTPDRCDGSEQVCKNSAGCANKSPAGDISSQEDETVRSLSFENEDGDTYNCSADLFSGSLTADTNTNTPSTHAETARTVREARSVLSKPDKQHLRSENVPHSTPDKLRSIKRDSLILSGTQELDFIPPSQSTPIVPHRTVTFSSSDRQDSCAFYRNLPESDHKRITSSFFKSSCVDANQLCQRGSESTKENVAWSTPSCRHSNRFTPKRRFWKPNEQKTPLRVQTGALNAGTTGRIRRKCDSGGCEDGEAVIVPPTPAARTGQSVTLRRRQTENSGRDEVNCKRTLLDQTVTSSSERGRTQTGSCDSEGTLSGSKCFLPDDENEACDWSRDLFSDSL